MFPLLVPYARSVQYLSKFGWNFSHVMTTLPGSKAYKVPSLPIPT